jgi:hypothetical protein
MNLQSNWRRVSSEPSRDPLAIERSPRSRLMQERVGLTRLMYVSAETSVRFQRDGLDLEPLIWLTEPHRLFDGKAAIEACTSEEGARRALALHGLGIGLDADPKILAGIPLSEFVTDAASPLVMPDRRQAAPSWGDTVEEEPALYTGTISASRKEGYIQVFCAMVTDGPLKAREKIRRRYGAILEEEAVVTLGFDWSQPLACSLVSEAMAEVLMLAETDPASPLAVGLDFHVEQRFVS